MEGIRLQSRIRYVGGGRFIGDQCLPNGHTLRVGSLGFVHAIPGAKAELGCTFGTTKVSLNYADAELAEDPLIQESPPKRPASAQRPVRPASASAARRQNEPLSRPGSAILKVRARAASVMGTSGLVSSLSVSGGTLSASSQPRLAPCIAAKQTGPPTRKNGTVKLKPAALAIAVASLDRQKDKVDHLSAPLGPLVGTQALRCSAASTAQTFQPTSPGRQPGRRRSRGTVAAAGGEPGTNIEPRAAPVESALPANDDEKQKAPQTRRPKEEQFTVNVLSLAGDILASLTTAHSSWKCEEVREKVAAAIALLPGHEIQLVGPAANVLEGATTLEEVFPGLCTPGTVHELTGTKVRKEGAQKELDVALIEAAMRADIARAEVLIEAGASAAYVKRDDGVWGAYEQTAAIHEALKLARRKDAPDAGIDMVKLLLNARADINSRCGSSDWRGCGSESTALELGMQLGMKKPELFQCFLDAGADPNSASSQSIHSMRTDGHIVHFLINKAVKEEKVDIVKLLLDRRADANARDHEHISNERGYDQHLEQTALHIACTGSSLEMVKVLLQHGADVNRVREELEQQDNPEHKKLQAKAKKSKKMIIEDDPREGGYVSPVVCTPVKETPIHIALSRKKADLVAALRAAGADSSIPRISRGKQTSCVELCNKDESLLTALQTEPLVVGTAPTETVEVDATVPDPPPEGEARVAAPEATAM
mmetsp:Transcript_27295/g.62863  ORF Transcript_27295/g.62863 Transcript_27295/m.62863 type:complete len:711 (-) Transcript_27295:128-2260(-)